MWCEQKDSADSEEQCSTWSSVALHQNTKQPEAALAHWYSVQAVHLPPDLL